MSESENTFKVRIVTDPEGEVIPNSKLALGNPNCEVTVIQGDYIVERNYWSQTTRSLLEENYTAVEGTVMGETGQYKHL